MEAHIDTCIVGFEGCERVIFRRTQNLRWIEVCLVSQHYGNLRHYRVSDYYATQSAKALTRRGLGDLARLRY